MHLLSALTLLPFTLASPLLTPSSTPAACSPATFQNITTFPLTAYQIDTVTLPRDNGIQGSTSLVATFSITNPGTGDTYLLDRIPISTGGGVWSTCLAGEKGLPSNLNRCQYLVERRSEGRIGFRLGWACGGLNFDATLIGDWPGEECTSATGVEGVTQSCKPIAKEVALEIANIYWEETQGY